MEASDPPLGCEEPADHHVFQHAHPAVEHLAAQGVHQARAAPQRHRGARLIVGGRARDNHTPSHITRESQAEVFQFSHTTGRVIGKHGDQVWVVEPLACCNRVLRMAGDGLLRSVRVVLNTGKGETPARRGRTAAASQDVLVDQSDVQTVLGSLDRGRAGRQPTADDGDIGAEGAQLTDHVARPARLFQTRPPRDSARRL